MRSLALTGFFFIAALLLNGCRQAGPALATLMPTLAAGAAEQSSNIDQSPRAVDEESSSMIPPTWTPGPSADAIPAQQPSLPTRQPEETYIVQPGDTLAEIAETYGIELQRLATANSIVNVDFIFTGQVLTIPQR